MHEIGPIIIFVGLLVFLAHFFVALFERTRVPDVVYLILIGVVIGPVLQIITPEDFGKVGSVFTTIALVVILFEGGLELGIEALRSTWRPALWITLLSYGSAFVLLSSAAWFLLPLSAGAAIFVGAVMAGPAPSVIIPLVRNLRLVDSTRTTLMLESPIGEALCIVTALAVLQSLQLNELHVGKLAGSLVSSFALAIVIGMLGGYVWSILLERMRQLRHAIFTTPSFVFILYGVAEFLGFSGPVTALVFGITLGNARLLNIPWLTARTKLTPVVHNELEKSFFGEIVFLLKTFFFVYLGLSVQLTDLRSLAAALTLCALLLLSRMLSVQYAMRGSLIPRTDLLMMSVIIPKGTAAAVLASVPLQLGITGGEQIQNVIYGVVIWSILLTSLFILLLERSKPEMHDVRPAVPASSVGADET